MRLILSRQEVEPRRSRFSTNRLISNRFSFTFLIALHRAAFYHVLAAFLLCNNTET